MGLDIPTTYFVGSGRGFPGNRLESMAEQLDPTPLGNAIARLGEGLTRYRQDTADDQIRDGLIQRFEFTYESCHKMLERYLRLISPTPEEVDHMAFADLIRHANERGLLCGDWPIWRGYREMRAKTSHTYDEGIALEVVAGIPGFLEEARFLYDRLEQYGS